MYFRCNLTLICRTKKLQRPKCVVEKEKGENVNQLSEKSKEKSYPQMAKAFYWDLLPAAKQKPSQGKHCNKQVLKVKNIQRWPEETTCNLRMGEMTLNVDTRNSIRHLQIKLKASKKSRQKYLILLLIKTIEQVNMHVFGILTIGMQKRVAAMSSSNSKVFLFFSIWKHYLPAEVCTVYEEDLQMLSTISRLWHVL